MGTSLNRKSDRLRGTINAPPLFLPWQYFRDASVWDPELPGDVARPHAVVGQFDDPLADNVGERSAVHEDAAQLIHAAMTWNKRDK